MEYLYIMNNVIRVNPINDIVHFVVRNHQNQMINNQDLYRQILNDIVINYDFGCRSYKTEFNDDNKFGFITAIVKRT